MSSSLPQIGFAGLGNMGKYMATNLANALAASSPPRKLLVWNRTLSKAQDVARDTNGAAIPTDTATQLAQQCDVIFTSLASDAAVESVITEMLEAARSSREALRPGKSTVFCETSTVFPDLTTKLEALVAGTGPGFHYCAALPFGQPPVAKAAQLVFAIAGKREARDAVEDLIVPHMGRQLMDLGEEPSKASSFKLIGNSMILSLVETISETMTLSEKAGISSDRVLEWINLFYPAPSAINYGTKIANLKFEASGGFDLKGGLKDATHIHNLGQQHGCPTHIVDTAIQHIKAAQRANEGQADKDWAALVGAQRIESGLPPFSKE